MSVNTDRIQYLFRRYTQKTCTREELQELFVCIAQPENRALLEQMMDSEYDVLQPLAAANETDWEYIFQQVTQTKEGTVFPLDNKNRFRWARVAAAAVVVLALGIGGYWFFNRLAKNNVAKSPGPVQQPIGDVQPGGNKAVLTLADGSVITLDSAHNGLLAKQGATTVLKSNNGVAYAPSTGGGRGEAGEAVYNMLATPRGGQYQLVLPDGSKVWLNAASSIRYPVAFAGNERRVELTGEAYFEIEKVVDGSGAKMPFIVSMLPSAGGAGAEVEVLGTHFNVNAYSDEPAMATTLLEGKVKVSSMVNGQWSMLKPGQQAAIHHSQLTIHDNIDLEQAVAWKNGLTAFKSADIKSIMRQVARWYNVEVMYEGVTPQRSFTGGISRDAKLSELLHLLEVSKVHFRLEGDKLTVMP
jgi:ferric-dicitrate binding protein FerR (iron transport regulator)